MADNVVVSNSSAASNPDYRVWTDEVTVSAVAVQKQMVGIVDATADGTTRAAVGANGLAVSATITGTVPIPTGAATAANQLLPIQAATATLANVSGSASSVTLQALNTNRKGLVIVNDSTAILYVKFGSTASSTSYTYLLAGSSGGIPATLELPGVVYTGIVTGIWASATGAARVTELT